MWYQPYYQHIAGREYRNPGKGCQNTCGVFCHMTHDEMVFPEVLFSD